MREYKVGDKVKIREWNDMVEEFGVDDYDYRIQIPKTASFLSEMRKFCGLIGKITDVCDGGYHLDFGYGEEDWIFVPEMFEAVDLETDGAMVCEVTIKMPKDIICKLDCVDFSIRMKE